MSGRVVHVQHPQIVELVGISDRILAVELTLRGLFKGEIARLDEQSVELDRKLGMLKNVEDAATIKAEADAYEARTRADMESLASRTAAAAATVDARLATVEARERGVKTAEDKAASRGVELDKREREMSEPLLAKDADLRRREAKVEGEETVLKAAQEKLARDVAAFNARLDALRVA